MDVLDIFLGIILGAIVLFWFSVWYNCQTGNTREENLQTNSAPRQDDYKVCYGGPTNHEPIGLRHVRNEHRQMYRDNNNSRPRKVVDLHGLFQNEALKVLDECLRTLKEEGYRTAVIITGKGNNSKGGIAVLKPAVEGYLQANQFWFVEQSGGGSFEVSL
ncbi:uncharacterized protein [Watersipora subatra]|uniref:uncharacterized protein isoform X5 n=1 Tax=Watersipora subatra TaxID=2589382 RepID=UPI00355C490C